MNTACEFHDAQVRLAVAESLHDGARRAMVAHIRGEMAAGRLTIPDLQQFVQEMNAALSLVAEGFDNTDCRRAAWRDAAVEVLREHNG